VQTTKQQQILGYFIEEAKEHLDSIETGLLNLSQTMSDAEEMNQIFRAAHSIKGGAAMLGFNSIQRVSHHFEDAFKILKENPQVNIDRKLEDLFLKGFDGLKALVDQLQSTFGLREEDADQIVQSTEPTFAALGQYLNQLIQAGSAAAPTTQPLAAPNASEQVSKILKVMLQLFKQGDNAKSRQQLIALCTRLMQIAPKNQPWIHLGQTAQRAIANQANAYSQLAPVIIKELKQSSDLLLAGRSGEIIPSTTLQRLTQKPAVPSVANLETMRLVTQVRAHPLPLEQVESATKTVKSPAAAPGMRPRSISIPNEPRAAARALLEAFSKAELIQLAEFLMKSIQS
jgi:chemotaxis protein histidine kinase CheA